MKHIYYAFKTTFRQIGESLGLIREPIYLSIQYVDEPDLAMSLIAECHAGKHTNFRCSSREISGKNYEIFWVIKNRVKFVVWSTGNTVLSRLDLERLLSC